MLEIVRCDAERIEIRRTLERGIVGALPIVLAALLAFATLFNSDDISTAVGFGITALFLLSIFGVGLGVDRNYPTRILLCPETRSYACTRGMGNSRQGILGEHARVEVSSELLFGSSGACRLLLHPGNGEPPIPLLTNRVHACAVEQANRIAVLLGAEVIDVTPSVSLPAARRAAETTPWAPQRAPLSDEVIAREIEEFNTRAAKVNGGWEVGANAAEIQRFDEEELRISKPRKAHRYSLALAVYALVVAALVNTIYSRTSGDASTLTSAGASLAFVVALAALFIAKPRWVSVRHRDRRVAFGSGWREPLEWSFDDVRRLSVERKRGLFGKGHWVISVQRKFNSVPVWKTRSGRDARLFAEALSRRIGVEYIDNSGALPSLTALDASPRVKEEKPAAETPEQAAAREDLRKLGDTFGRSVARWRNATGFSAIVCALAPMILGAFYFPEPNFIDGDKWLLMLAPFVIMMLISACGWFAAQSRLGTEFGKIDSTAAVGPLLDLLGENSGRGLRSVQRALAKLLPRLRPADGKTLTASQRDSLRKLLRTPRAKGLWGREDLVGTVTIATLRALEQIGDERDIPVVESLLAGADTEMRQEIAGCLEALYHHSELTRTGATLLRPVEAAAGNDALLRPAVGSSVDQDTSTLLRAPADEEEPVRSYAQETNEEVLELRTY